MRAPICYRNQAEEAKVKFIREVCDRNQEGVSGKEATNMALKDEWKFTKRKGVRSLDMPNYMGIKGQFSASGWKLMGGGRSNRCSC